MYIVNNTYYGSQYDFIPGPSAGYVPIPQYFKFYTFNYSEDSNISDV